MKKPLQDILIPLCLSLLGLTVFLISGMAYHLGIAHSSVWGFKRVILALLGGTCLFMAVIFYFRVFLKRFFKSPKRRVYCGLLISCLSVLVFYGWFLAHEPINIDVLHNDYYDKLATAFMRGQLYLEENPPAELAALADPYNAAARKGITYIWDASYYKGKYYLYFGPLPALLLVPVKWLLNIHVDDRYLVFTYLYAIFLLISLILVKFWRQFFPDLTGWPVIAGSLAAGVGLPAIWMLSSPRIYEAAILSGQFWLIAGLFLTYMSFQGPRLSLSRLVASAVCLSFAVGSRINLLAAVSGISIIVFFRICIITSTRGSRLLLASFAYLFPIVLVGAALLAYNYFRFGNPFENGWTYLLTSAYWQTVGHPFALVFFIPNFYMYFLFSPLSWKRSFPFMQLLLPKLKMFPNFIHLPDHYQYTNSSNIVIGILLAAPVVLFALPAFWVTFRKARSFFQGKAREVDWALLLLSAGFIMPFLSIMVFFYTDMRYMGDFLPILYILSAVGAWLVCARLSHISLWRRTLIMFFSLLTGYGMISSILIGIANTLQHAG